MPKNMTSNNWVRAQLVAEYSLSMDRIYIGVGMLGGLKIARFGACKGGGRLVGQVNLHTKCRLWKIIHLLNL
jgi:hypothetical protein